ncbi:hypothetical protein AB4072_08070 [Microvirga sp. 2MCAF38]|uniref:hypothetical protein n=1 Tax=Microvirga sp. 2MCAF38 TaxID=3232989 RepID=UPI003F9B61BC
MPSLETSTDKGFRFEVPGEKWAWAIFLSIAFVVLQIKASLWGGRLLLPPTYDDVGYFNDAILRLKTIHDEGVVAGLNQYIKTPPHSPLYTALAMFGFTVFGTVPWAAAAATALPLVLIIRLFFAVSGLPIRLSALLVAAFLLMPYAYFLTVEFRPDGFTGVFLASGAMMTVLMPWLERGCIQAGAGVLFGAALLAKPSFLPLTLVVMFASVGLAALPAVRDTKAWRKLATASGVTLGIALLLAAPYYVVGYQHVFQYIYHNTQAPSAVVWGGPLPLPERLAYYLIGVGAGPTIGGWLFVTLALLAAALAWNVVFARWDILYRIGSAVVVAGLAYFILTFTNTRSSWIGLGFTGFAFVGLAVGAVWLCRFAREKGHPTAALTVTIALLLGALVTFRLPTYAPTDIGVADIFRASVKKKLTRTDLIGMSLQQVADAERASLDRVVDVLSTIPDLKRQVVYMGPIAQYVNPSSLQYTLIQRGSAHPKWAAPYIAGKMQQHASAMKKATYAILFTPDSTQPLEWLPSNDLREALMSTVPEAGFEEMARLPDASGRGQIIVFRRASRA